MVLLELDCIHAACSIRHNRRQIDVRSRAHRAERKVVAGCEALKSRPNSRRLCRAGDVVAAEQRDEVQQHTVVHVLQPDDVNNSARSSSTSAMGGLSLHAVQRIGSPPIS